jgi:hypothetical protein
MAIVWSRISSKVIANPPFTREARRSGVETADALRLYVYRKWPTKESRECSYGV